jgi:hypothetical protein
VALREVNVFGLTMTTGTNEELEAEAEAEGKRVYHVVLRVADEKVPPYPALAERRFKTLCTDCRQICWIDPVSLVIPTALVVCTQCMLVRVEEKSCCD